MFQVYFDGLIKPEQGMRATAASVDRTGSRAAEREASLLAGA